MKNLGFKSKNILAILLVLLIVAVVDVAIGQLFFSLAGGTIALAPAFVDLNKPSASCNMAGISTTAYVIATDDIESMPTVTPVVGDPSTYVTYIGDFTLKAGKRWKTFYSTKEMGELLSEMDGPTDGSFFRNKGSLFYPGTTAEALGTMYLLKDADVIVILKEFSGGGQMRVVGDLDIPASFTGSENSGKGFGDEKGITWTIEAASCKPSMVYSGAVPTSESAYIYTETDETGTDAQYVDGYDGITGWSKEAYPVLWFDVWDNATVITLRAFTTEANRDLATGAVFHVIEGGNTVIEQNSSGFGGTLTLAAGGTDGNTFYVTVT